MNTYGVPQHSRKGRLTAPRRRWDGTYGPSLLRHIINSIGVFTLVAAAVVFILNFMIMVRRGEAITPETIAARTTQISKTASEQVTSTITPVTSAVTTAYDNSKATVAKIGASLTVQAQPPETSSVASAASAPATKVTDTTLPKTIFDTEPQIVADLAKPLDVKAASVLTKAVETSIAPAISDPNALLPSVESQNETQDATVVTDPSIKPMLLPGDNSEASPPTTSPLATKMRYAYGQCTYYVASRRPVPAGWGNARDWYWHAKAVGWVVSDTPSVGAIAWTPAGYYGHVAYVEKFDGTSVTISEMNYRGWNKISTRTMPISAFRYIY